MWLSMCCASLHKKNTFSVFGRMFLRLSVPQVGFNYSTIVRLLDSLIVFLFFTHHLVCVKIYRFVSLVYSCFLMFLVLWYVLHHVSIYGGVSTIFWQTSLWFIILNLPSLNPCCARRLFFTLLFATCSNQFRSSLFPKCCAIIGSANIKISFHSLPQP